MFKLFSLLLLIAAIQSFNAELIFQKPKPVWYHQYLPIVDENGVKYLHTRAAYTGVDFPADLGGNFGDLIHHRREQDDRLVLREVLINEDIFKNDVEFTYDNRVDGINITTIRAVNIGRERAFVETISSSDHGLVKVVGLVKGQQQMRLLIEAYGKEL